MAYTTIKKPSDYFNTKLYTGTGSTQSITGLDFQPDLVWGKTRNDTQDHQIIDSVRGATKLLATNGTGAEFTDTNNLTSFNSNGFTVGSSGGINGSGDTLVSWNWKANGAGSANTDGSISSTVSANTTSGFSIVTVADIGSGDFTFGHGLGVAPSWVLAKSRDGSKWNNYFKSLGAGYTIQLPETSAKITNAVMWQNTDPTSSVVYANGNQLDSNESYVFYCFAEKKGYSKFGSYTGNGNADGTFVYTGFKPAWIMIKESSHAGNAWHIRDIKRSPINVVDDSLYANENIAEVTNNTALNTDFLSNGFKLRNTDTNDNGSGRTYIYMCFAESPLVNSNGVPCNAR